WYFIHFCDEGYRMTVGVAVVCDKGNRIVLGCDSRLSSEWTDVVNDRGGKAFNLPLDFCALIAGGYSSCQSFVSELYNQFHKLPHQDVFLAHIKNAVTEAQFLSIREAFDGQLRCALGINVEEWRNLNREKSRLYRAGKALYRHMVFPVE